MKRQLKSMTLFLGVWLAVLAVGYITSRVTVFAAATQCMECQFCKMMNTYWVSNLNSVSGWVWAGSNSPADNAVTGTKEGGSLDLYASGGCDGNSTQQVTENKVEFVSYGSADLTCTHPVPYPKGAYECMNGQNINHTGITYYPSICATN